MRIAVFGAGAVGAYFGGRLIETGKHDVSLIARGPHLEALQTRGLRIESPEGDAQLPPDAFTATNSPEDVGQVDAVFVTVKTWVVPEAAVAIGPLVGDKTIVIPLQNGVEAPDQLTAEVSGGHVIGGTCRIFTDIVEPGVVRHTGVPPTITIGELDGSVSESVEELQAALSDAGIFATARADIRAAMWEKLIFVGPLGRVGAVTRVPIGVFRSVPRSRELLQTCMEEIAAVAAAEGVSLQPDAVEGAMKLADLAPVDGTASMQRDIASGRPSELEAQVGVIPRLGQRHNVPTSAHDAIYAALLPAELKARGQL